MALSAAATPLQRAFWFGQVDARPLALFRIGLGALLALDWVLLWPDLGPLFSNAGIFENGGPLPAWKWTLFALAPSPGGVQALWGVGLLALLALTAGFRTRLSTFAAWVSLVSLHNRNSLLLTGGDRLVELLLLTSLFTELGACWSVDARLKPRPPLASALGLRFLQLEVALMYFFTARLKFRGLWTSGQGIWISLQHPGFLRPPGALLLQVPALAKLLNFVVLGLELAFAFLAFSPLKRKVTVPLAIACALAVQLGIFANMRVGMFTAIMIWVNVLFLEPAWLDRLGLRVTALEAPPLAVTSRQKLAAGVLVLMVMLVTWDFVIGRRVPMPGPLRAVHSAASLEQLFELFGVSYDVARWEAVGTRADGTTVEVLGEVAPGINPGPGWRYSPWYKLTFAEPLLERPTLARWVCRRYAEVSGTQLVSLTLNRRGHPPPLIGEPVAPDTVVELWSGPCSTASAAPP